MDQNYTINRKNIELTEKGKQKLVQWAIKYYDEQNQEPEAVDIVDVNIPVEQQQMDIVLKKLEKSIEMLEKKFGLSKLNDEEWRRHFTKTKVNAIIMGIAGSLDIVASFILMLLTKNGYWFLGGEYLAIALLPVYLISSSYKQLKERIKKKYDKYHIKTEKAYNALFNATTDKEVDKANEKINKLKRKGQQVELYNFAENEYTLLFLEKLYNELLVQNESIKNVLKAGV